MPPFANDCTPYKGGLSGKRGAPTGPATPQSCHGAAQSAPATPTPRAGVAARRAPRARPPRPEAPP